MKKAMIVILALVLVLVLVLCAKSCKKETPAGETTIPTTENGETTVPETTVHETTVPETTGPETTVHETTVPAGPAYPTDLPESEARCYIGYFTLENGPSTYVSISFANWDETYSWKTRNRGGSTSFVTLKDVIEEGKWFKYEREEAYLLYLRKAWDAMNGDLLIDITFGNAAPFKEAIADQNLDTYTTKAGHTFLCMDGDYYMFLGDTGYYICIKQYNSDHGTGDEFEYLTIEWGTGW